jgi:hypothetical protein
MVKLTKKYIHPNSNFKYGSFQHKHKKEDSKLFQSLIIEISMLPSNFDIEYKI